MTDIEINELSIEVITSIAEDLRVAYYDKVGGLTFSNRHPILGLIK